MEHNFENVTMYCRGGFGNIVRKDVKTLKITEGQKYAQYNDATRVQYLEPRKRLARAFMLTYKPFLVVLRREEAFEPDSMLVPTEKVGNVTVTQGRYSSCDTRWAKDFCDKLKASGAKPLFMVGTGDEIGIGCSL